MTARQPDSQTARQPDSQTARQPDSQTARQPGKLENSDFQRCANFKLRGMAEELLGHLGLDDYKHLSYSVTATHGPKLVYISVALSENPDIRIGGYYNTENQTYSDHMKAEGNRIVLSTGASPVMEKNLFLAFRRSERVLFSNQATQNTITGRFEFVLDREDLPKFVKFITKYSDFKSYARDHLVAGKSIWLHQELVNSEGGEYANLILDVLRFQQSLVTPYVESLETYFEHIEEQYGFNRRHLLSGLKRAFVYDRVVEIPIGKVAGSIPTSPKIFEVSLFKPMYWGSEGTLTLKLSGGGEDPGIWTTKFANELLGNGGEVYYPVSNLTMPVISTSLDTEKTKEILEEYRLLG